MLIFKLPCNTADQGFSIIINIIIRNNKFVLNAIYAVDADKRPRNFSVSSEIQAENSKNPCGSHV